MTDDTDMVTVPKTPEAAVDALAEVSALITAKQWARAAIIAAVVGPAPGKGRRSDKAGSRFMRLTDLAAKGIVGLTDDETIGTYRDRWCAQRPVPAMGQKVDLSGLPTWPGVPEERLALRTSMTAKRRERLQAAGVAHGMATGAKVVDVAANPKAVEAAIIADPQTMQVAERAVAEAHLRAEATEAGFPQGDGPHPTVPDPRPVWDRDISRISHDARRVADAITTLREEGKNDEADTASRELREVALWILTRLDSENVPDRVPDELGRPS